MQPRLCQGIAERMIGSYMSYLQLALEFLLKCLMNLLNVERRVVSMNLRGQREPNESSAKRK
jgi:hypothetical protein